VTKSSNLWLLSFIIIIAAVQPLSNNENLKALADQRLSYLALNGIFRFVHAPSTFETEDGNEDGGIFYPI
jgi:hypothetical protein